MFQDFDEMLLALHESGAEYLVVGAHAMAAHGVPRATGDLDIWVRPTAENALRVYEALSRFGAPLTDLTPGDLQTPGTIFQIGVVPIRVDIITHIDGGVFEDAWRNRLIVPAAQHSIPYIGLEDLIANKSATGRPKDVADVVYLKEALRIRP